MKLVILGRDGTINAEGDPYITSADDWTPLPGALDAIARLNHAGYRVVIACNQPVLGRGLIDVATLNAIHARMHKSLAAVGARVDAVFYCPHTADTGCDCRKPKPGLLKEVAKRFGVDMSGVPVVGDGLRDLQAAESVGGLPMLVLTGKGEKTLREGSFPKNTVIFPDLAFAVSALLAAD